MKPWTFLYQASNVLCLTRQIFYEISSITVWLYRDVKKKRELDFLSTFSKIYIRISKKLTWALSNNQRNLQSYQNWYNDTRFHKISRCCSFCQIHVKQEKYITFFSIPNNLYQYSTSISNIIAIKQFLFYYFGHLLILYFLQNEKILIITVTMDIYVNEVRLLINLTGTVPKTLKKCWILELRNKSQFLEYSSFFHSVNWITQVKSWTIIIDLDFKLHIW